ncbi:GntR family transcriptional regulator [Nocardia jiangxiensis]|uniref:GntR family transcriptional regulator n=1 Tax=Nocardia jiangxiensis TaxID=282685 RepID=A0ABW6S7A5_9NOCA|nr:GntR family transcriptional regulator [Nocardia jiangxiensis]
MADRAGSDSLHEQLQRICREAAEMGTPLPPEIELARRLGVSRPMVREALVGLEAHGLVARRAHQGTFPNVSAFSVALRIDQSYELSTLLEDAGFEVEVDVISVEWSTVNDVEAADLAVPTGSQCLRVVKRWLGDGTPRIAAEDVIPARRRDDVVFDTKYSVFEIVEVLRGESVEWESAKIGAVVPEGAWREVLALDDARPALSITLVGASLHGTRLYRAHELHLMDGLEYGMVRRAVRRG